VRGNVALIVNAPLSLLGSRNYYAHLWAQVHRLAGRPTLLVWGVKNPAFGPNYLARWRERLADARVLTLADAGHWPHEESPKVVAETIRALLENRPVVA
jgi:haloalkane dehalogenase